MTEALIKIRQIFHFLSKEKKDKYKYLTNLYPWPIQLSTETHVKTQMKTQYMFLEGKQTLPSELLEY